MATILILGGLGQDGARQLIPYLLSSAGPSPAFLRIVDRYFILPQADPIPSTTYLDLDARQALSKGSKEGKVEYLQGNLLTEATRTKAFTLPEAHGGPAKGFDYVFDFTGEHDYSLPDAVHIERTLRLALLLGKSAVDFKVGAYVRLLATQYKLAGDKKGKVGEQGEGSAEPWGVRAGWLHESARGLAKIEGLNLVLLRPATFYGDYTVTGLTPRVLIGEVYRYLGEKLEFLWKESTAVNTIHSIDFSSAAVAIAEWAAKNGAATVLSQAGEDLPTTLKSNDLIKDVACAAKKEDKVRAAVFSVVDDGETTQKEIAKVIEEVVGVEAGFHGSIISSFAKLNMGDVLEDVNDKHLEGWSALLTASNPPISTTVPISPNTPADLLQPYPISFSNALLKQLTGWAPTRKLDAATVRETVDKFKKEGNWPNAPPKSKR
ncbi:hypothetical protein BCR35DRAFT_293345 [Leucosporidium creatinivorum]|uniref:NAD-dependent epimerase/dehydratase domain-containing protein n=1 Tax=Leucosporidium creatinivorum TaxID=106004 RepID=A0A1Y2ERP5_9BASI|nr:hypothetical protein BCR35DRAFT_293345 [Leucosporidium creatinivorum]